MEKIELNEICDLSNGYAFKSSDYIDESNTLNCRMSNIRPDGTFNILYNAKYLPDEYVEKYEKFILKDGDLIIAMTDMAGDPKILGVPTVVDTKGYRLLLNQRVGKLIFLGKRDIDTRYLKFAISSRYVRNYLKRFAGGGLQLNVSKKDILSIPIIYREIDKQREISETLEKILRIKELKENQLKELDNLVKSRFIEMFGDPVNNERGWDLVKLKELTTHIHSGNTPKGGRQVYVDEGIMFFRSQNVWKNRIELDDIAYITEDIHQSMLKSSLKKKDILMTKTGRINTENSSLGRAAMYMGEDDQANVNGHVYLIRAKKNVISEFILFIITTLEYRDHIRNVCVGGIDKRQLNKNHIEGFPIIQPPIEDQQKFVALWKQVDKLKVEVQKSLDEIQLLFDSLMQEYFD